MKSEPPTSAQRRFVLSVLQAVQNEIWALDGARVSRVGPGSMMDDRNSYLLALGKHFRGLELAIALLDRGPDAYPEAETLFAYPEASTFAGQIRAELDACPDGNYLKRCWAE